jgi:hypothetical protein
MVVKKMCEGEGREGKGRGEKRKQLDRGKCVRKALYHRGRMAG